MAASDRQSTFSGTKEVAERLRFDVGRLEDYLRDHVKGFGGPVTVQQFNEGAGGQVVFHLHLHIIPRKNGVPMKPPASEKEKPDVLADHALKLAAALKDA